MTTTNSPGLEWAALSDQGQRRQNNEDAWNAVALGDQLTSLPGDPRSWPEPGFLLIVSDGMGGAKAGEVASRLCIERLASEVHARRGHAQPAVALKEAFLATHGVLVEAADADPAKEGMGATLSALWLKPDGTWVVGHVGDTRIYTRRNGTWNQVTEDQSVGAAMVRRGELSADDVNRLRYRSMLEQVMGGDGAPLEPQIESGRWEMGQEFLLCSDGLYGPMGDTMPALIDGAFHREPLANGAKWLVDSANAAGGPDNITVLLARLVPNQPA